MTKFNIRTQDREFLVEDYKKIKKNDIYIVLDNLRSASNVGSVFRSAETLLAKEILLCGTTVTPENIKLQKTAMGTEQFVDWKYFKYTKDAINYLKDKKIEIIAFETTNISLNLYDVDINIPIGVVFGNEALGIEPEIVGMCDRVVEIPLQGYKNSLNVANAASISLFEIARKNGVFK